MSPEPRGEAATRAVYRPGIFVAVVGPSGAGKDTLIRRAAEDPTLPDIVRFARRIVTRAPHLGSEDHDMLDEPSFLEAEAGGRFSLTWAAHGLRYALGRMVLSDLREGCVVVANVSRRSLGAASASFGALHVVEITARPDLLEARIAARGRETGADLGERIQAQPTLQLPSATAGYLRIDNSGEIGPASALLVDHLHSLCREIASAA